MEHYYEHEEVEYILHAYRSIFPSVSKELEDYLGWQRSRPWSCLTSDFHTATYQQFVCLDEKIDEIELQGLDYQKKGEALRDASIALGVGYSIGICPWTDNLLQRTYSDEKDSAVVLLGHDWYPIVLNPDDRRAGSPLYSRDSLHSVERYWPAAPESVLAREKVGFFFNLYPDYRPPGDVKCGALGRYGYTYAQCIQGADALVDALCRRFSQVHVISWGVNVWQAVLPRVHGVASTTLLSQHIEGAPGQPLSVEMGGRTLPYLPLFHPSHWGNFGRLVHLRHVKHGFSELGLGLPGMQGSAAKRVARAREIAFI